MLEGEALQSLDNSRTALQVDFQAEGNFFFASHLISRDSAPFGTTIWIQKHKNGPRKLHMLKCQEYVATLRSMKKVLFLLHFST